MLINEIVHAMKSEVEGRALLAAIEVNPKYPNGIGSLYGANFQQVLISDGGEYYPSSLKWVFEVMEETMPTRSQANIFLKERFHTNWMNYMKEHFHIKM